METCKDSPCRNDGGLGGVRSTPSGTIGPDCARDDRREGGGGSDDGEVAGVEGSAFTGETITLFA